MHRSLKRNLVIGLAALGVAASAGAAYAATQNSGPSTRQAFLNDVAKRLHVTPQQLSSALNGAATDQLQAAVKAGRLTQAQANALEQRLKNGGPAPPLPLPPGFVGPKAFIVPPGGAFKPGPPALGFPGFGLGLGPAASYLGLSTTQLFQELNSGKSLAQIAATKGKTVAGLEQVMTAPIRKALDEAVAHKAITAAQETQILSHYTARLSKRINEKGLVTPRREFFRGGAAPPYAPLFVPVPGGGSGSKGQMPPSVPIPGKLPVPPAALPVVPYLQAPSA
jgi:hypothetical protein